MGESPPMLAPPSSPASLLPGFGVIGNHEGLPYFNSLGWIERLDIPHVYRAVSLEGLAGRSPEVQGFEPDMTVGGRGTIVNGQYLLTLETQEAAVDYGHATFGAGNFALFRIDTNGVPAMPYRLNVNYDMWRASPPVAEAFGAGQPVTPNLEWLSSYVHFHAPDASEVPAGYEPLGANDIAAYQRAHVFIDNHAVQPQRIHRIV